MTRVLVLYSSSYGHIERMAEAVADGARQVEGIEVTVKRVPELVPEEIARQSGMKLEQAAPIATPQELAEYRARRADRAEAGPLTRAGPHYD